MTSNTNLPNPHHLVELARRHRHSADFTDHYDGCEEIHMLCLIQKLADTVEALISARSHGLWQRLEARFAKEE